MTRPRTWNRNSTRFYRGAGKGPVLTPPDPNEGRDGFAKCSVCDRWIRLRADGTLRGHNMVPKKSGDHIPCMG